MHDIALGDRGDQVQLSGSVAFRLDVDVNTLVAVVHGDRRIGVSRRGAAAGSKRDHFFRSAVIQLVRIDRDRRRSGDRKDGCDQQKYQQKRYKGASAFFDHRDSSRVKSV